MKSKVLDIYMHYNSIKQMDHTYAVYNRIKKDMVESMDHETSVKYKDKCVVTHRIRTNEPFSVISVIVDLFKDLDNIECKHYYDSNNGMNNYLVCKFPNPYPQIPKSKSNPCGFF